MGKQDQAKLRVKENPEVSVGALGSVWVMEQLPYPTLLDLTVSSTEQSCPSIHVGPQATSVWYEEQHSCGCFCILSGVRGGR